ncbi:unnamed protein product, partial [Laminaria digitata]
MELSLLGSSITYEPGDVIGIRCPNSVNDTDYVLARLQVTIEYSFTLLFLPPPPPLLYKTPQETLPPEAGPDVPFMHSLRSLPSPCTLRDALSTRLDVQAPLRRPVLRALAECCEDVGERGRMELLCAKT